MSSQNRMTLQKFGVTCPNPVVPLLSVSYQVRHVTLDILAQTLDLPYVKDGVGRYAHHTFLDTNHSPDAVHARLKNEKPWGTICAYRRLNWHAKHSFSALPSPAAPSPERERKPALSVYVALAVLQRAEHCARAYVNAGGDERLANAWDQDAVNRWMQHAMTQLAVCSEAFVDVLRPRVADACTKAHIGARSIRGSMCACMLTRMHTAEVYMMHRRAIRTMWMKIKEFNTGSAAAEDPGDVPESAEDKKHEPGVKVRIQWPCCRALGDTACRTWPRYLWCCSGMCRHATKRCATRQKSCRPPSRWTRWSAAQTYVSLLTLPFQFVPHVRHMLISLMQYLAYLEILAEIIDWDADGKTHKECNVIARSLSAKFKERLKAMGRHE